MPRHVPLPASLQNQPFAIARGSANGLTKARMLSRDLHRPFSGVRASDDDFRTAEAQAWAYAQRMPATHFFSHTTAARLWHLPVPRVFSPAEPVHVSSLDRDRIRCAGTVGHQPRDRSIRPVRLGRVRVSDAVSTWVQLASILSVDELVAVGDALVLDPVHPDRDAPASRPYATPEELRRRAAAFRGPGKRRLVEALELVRLGCESPKETELRLLIIRSGMPEPAINVPVPGLRLPYEPRLDLAYAEWKVIVEYDGEQHRTDAIRFAHDNERAAALREARWTLITVLKSGLVGTGRARTAAKVRRALLAAGWGGA